MPASQRNVYFLYIFDIKLQVETKLSNDNHFLFYETGQLNACVVCRVVAVFV